MPLFYLIFHFSKAHYMFRNPSLFLRTPPTDFFEQAQALLFWAFGNSATLIFHPKALLFCLLSFVLCFKTLCTLASTQTDPGFSFELPITTLQSFNLKIFPHLGSADAFLC